MSSDEEERELKKHIFKEPIEVQKARLDRLMKNTEKLVFIPERKEAKLPRAFQPHEFVRNVMGASAGAGSGEFDIYRGCRRRQIIREAYLSRVAKEKEENEKWEQKVEGSKNKAESQTAKRRQKRLKRKQQSKNKKKPNGEKADESSSSSDSESEDEPKEITSEEKQPETQPEKPPTPPPPVQKQPPEKTDMRKHIRHRKSNSSDEEQTETTN